MKLIRCHIENFGVLSDFDFSFAEGLTTICQSNGFGKSTFAAFIKAMFYGFPRTGARNIVENERKRYDPWQGGKYGGYLEFEVQDVSYRVTRYFGKTAAKDTFSLLDLTNRHPSTRFSEKLGEELFQLDADSFARSTYVPQLSASDMQATTSIRTKLSNLVDDTNDLRNYDTAEKKLRDYRTKFRAYRGEGGAINEIIRERLKLESDKYKAEQLRPGLQEVVESIDRLNGEKAIKTDAVNNLREKIRLASDQKVRIANQKQLNSLRLEVEKKQQYLQEMDEGYPVGYPNLDQDGRAWISADAIACENAVVCGDAVLTDHAVAKGCAYVGNNAMMTDHAIAQDDAAICGGLLTGESCVCGYAVIRQDEQTLCAPIIDGSARVYGEISGNVVCRGNAVVLPGTKFDNRTQDCFVLEDDRVSVQTASRTPPSKEPRTHDFER